MVYNKGYEQGSSSGGVKQSELKSHDAPRPIPSHVLRNIEKTIRSEATESSRKEKK